MQLLQEAGHKKAACRKFIFKLNKESGNEKVSKVTEEDSKNTSKEKKEEGEPLFVFHVSDELKELDEETFEESKRYVTEARIVDKKTIERI